MEYSDKPINEIQSLSRKPVKNGVNVVRYFSIKTLYRKYTSDGKACQGKFYEHTNAKHMGRISGHPVSDVVRLNKLEKNVVSGGLYGG